MALRPSTSERAAIPMAESPVDRPGPQSTAHEPGACHFQWKNNSISS
jgi:hypothetical protein